MTLGTREKELYLEQFEQQILSRRMVAVLAADADRLIDAVRDEGVAGYEEWLHDISRPNPRFRAGPVAAPALRHRGRPDPAAGGPLRDPDGVAERAGRTRGLQSCSSIADLLGRDAENCACGGDREAAGRRRQRAAGAVAAISRLCRVDPGPPVRARRHPLRSDGVHSAPQEGIISREVYDDLRRRSGAASRRASASGRRSISASNWRR